MIKNIEQLNDNTIKWAMKYLGTNEYTYKCLGFVEDALELSNNINIIGGHCAKESADIYKAYITIGIPPKGSFVFYDCIGTLKEETENWGHVGLAIDEGKLIHTWDKIRINEYNEIENLKNAPGWSQPKYIGWISIESIIENFTEGE